MNMTICDLASRILVSLQQRKFIELPREKYQNACADLEVVISDCLHMHPTKIARKIIDELMVNDQIDEVWAPDREIIPAIVTILHRAGLPVQ